jgi:hypothetical protein
MFNVEITLPPKKIPLVCEGAEFLVTFWVHPKTLRKCNTEPFKIFGNKDRIRIHIMIPTTIELLILPL